MKYCPGCGSKLSLKIPQNDDRERHVCDDCGVIHYQNPNIIVCSLPCYKDQVLLCKRSIEPRYGLWTLPGGFMENNETTLEGARRETLEEACARVEIHSLYSYYSLPHINQVHLFYRATLLDLDFAAGDDAAYEQALMQTSINNQAYKTLSESSERIPYVLGLLGHSVSHDDKLPPTFLMEMMEWNERIMDVGMSDDKDGLNQVTADFEKLEAEFETQLEALLSGYEPSKEESLLQEIKESYLQRKYLLRIRDSINKFARL